ncbi:hypothetical protein OA5_12600 [Vibrio cyclitrophicus 1F111]|uniref:DUF2971 domain-containing protein n=1 Tax=Vibrio cyclitrophicus TaxID=47951 RepID=UPI0002F5B019|nr:DUF2971 domain-containing protein [Vibrio cyclitrophicus]OEF80044.1 hypothetical protein OA5_12600 [Vibrio cyclitrophicus 1F111]
MSRFEPLYKFREVNEYSLSSITENTLWFSHVDDFNDPFELFYKIISGIDLNNMDEALEVYLSFAEKSQISNEGFKNVILKTLATLDEKTKHSIIEQISDKIKLLQDDKIHKVKSDNKIFSLSFANDHPLLWGHYANGLKGMCIEYDFNNQKQPLNIGYCPVDYLDKPFTINLLNLLKARTDISIYGNEIFATKNEVWAYEEEFRLISENEVMPGNKYQLSEGVISSIIIGEKMSVKDQLKVKNTIGDRNIKLYKAVAVPSDFRIDIVEYEN